MLPCWMLDTDYNGMVFCASQVFFPRTGAWDNLKKSLKAEFDDSMWDHLAGTESEPFALGDQRRGAEVMECASVSCSGHALRRMFERNLGQDVVLDVIRDGEMIADYPDDTPYPSRLLLGFVGGEPVHVVVAREPRQAHCFVVTAYRPDPGVWQTDFKHRR